MTSPFGSVVDTVINSDFVERRTMSFSLWAVFAEYSKKTPGSGFWPGRERMHPQSTGGLSARVALLQSPILPAAPPDYPKRSIRPSEEKPPHLTLEPN